MLVAHTKAISESWGTFIIERIHSKYLNLKHMNMESKKQEQQKACHYKKCQLSNKAWMSNILVLLHNMLSDPQLVPT
jgi:hypothetical protein